MSTNPPPKTKILVIDDEPVLLETIEKLLTPIYDIVTSSNGQLAIDTLTQRQDFDLIFCDLTMPGVDGIAVYEFLSKHHPELTKRFVLLTGGAYTERAIEFMKSTNPPCLDKPFQLKELRKVIEQSIPSKKTK